MRKAEKDKWRALVRALVIKLHDFHGACTSIRTQCFFFFLFFLFWLEEDPGTITSKYGLLEEFR